ncbi:unnamed protein product [Prunus armeniaca]
MSNMRRALERQEREDEEIKHRRAEEDHDADEEEEEMVVAVCMLNESRQHHHRCGLNVDGHRQSRASFVPKIMHDIFNYNTYFIQKYDVVGVLGDVIGVLGLLLKQKLIIALRMLAYGASAE